ncbi:MAG: nucleotidyltransferase domain-containing protein [Thermofilum sp.]|uniref:Polymerase nucleotidyl transferase domain-containing protein n=1 Tax=Thermofilum adornatum TaxID=1365176 RepID=S5ZNR9_9CREN|nr:nucleotidyltransferase domain-containing protein [Thermofilum adornatum]AGT36196.1 hypothetical protein N186_09300 [Thermofilum adornatum]
MSFPREDLAIEIQTWKLRELLKWRDYLEILVEAVKTVFGKGAEVYVFGSAVEGKLTVDSDVDIAIVLEEPPRTSREKIQATEQAMEIDGGEGRAMVVPLRDTPAYKGGALTPGRSKAG